MLVFEDLHSADDGAARLIETPPEWTGPLASDAAIGTARPELLARRPGWGGGKASALRSPSRRSRTWKTARSSTRCLTRRCCRRTSAATAPTRGGQPALRRGVRTAGWPRAGSLTSWPETVAGDRRGAARRAQRRRSRLSGRVTCWESIWLSSRSAPCPQADESWVLEERLDALERKSSCDGATATRFPGETEYAFRHLLVLTWPTARSPAPSGRRHVWPRVDRGPGRSRTMRRWSRTDYLERSN